MNKTWERVKIGDLLTQVTDIVGIEDDVLYRQVTVRMHNRGLVLRQECFGKEIKTKKQYLARSGQLIYSRIDARNGAMGIVPTELDGAVVSNDFPVFNIDCQRIDPSFLNYYISTEAFISDCLAQSKGTSNRRRLKEGDFLEIGIPLPSLEDQWRIVMRLNAIISRVFELEQLQRDIVKLGKAILLSSKNKAYATASKKAHPTKKLNEVAPINMGQSPVGNSYNQLGQGIPLLNGPTEFGNIHPLPIQWTTTPTKICKKGDILICVRGATTGRMNWADQEYCIGRGLAALSVDPQYCLPEYVYFFVETQSQLMLDLAKGTTFPNLSGEQLRSLQIPTPPLIEQEKVVTYIKALEKKVGYIQQLQVLAFRETQATIPSVLSKAFNGTLI